MQTYAILVVFACIYFLDISHALTEINGTWYDDLIYNDDCSTDNWCTGNGSQRNDFYTNTSIGQRFGFIDVENQNKTAIPVHGWIYDDSKSENITAKFQRQFYCQNFSNVIIKFNVYCCSGSGHFIYYANSRIMRLGRTPIIRSSDEKELETNWVYDNTVSTEPAACGIAYPVQSYTDSTNFIEMQANEIFTIGFGIDQDFHCCDYTTISNPFACPSCNAVAFGDIAIQCNKNNYTLSPTLYIPTQAPSSQPSNIPSIAPSDYPTFNPLTTTVTETVDINIISSLFEYRFVNVSFIVYNVINKSMHDIQSVIDNLYEANNAIEYEEIVVYQVVYVDNIVIINVRIEYNQFYENLILNYTLSDEYYDVFNKETEQIFNTSVIIKIVYVNIMDIQTTEKEYYYHSSVDYSEYLYIILLVLNIITILLTIISFFLHKIFKYKTDSAKSFVFILFGLRVTDIITDINVCCVLWFDYTENRDNSLLLILSICCLIFLILPWIANIYCILLVRKRTAKNKRTSYWFNKFQNNTFFVLLVFLTGDAFFALQVISSYIFGLNILNAGISEKIDIESLRFIKIFTIVLFENLPQLIIASIYTFVIDQNDDTVFNLTMLSIIISSISIFICILSWCLQTITQNQWKSFQLIEYIINVELLCNSNIIHQEKKRIMKNIGYKQKMKRHLCLALGADENEMEIVYTNTHTNGCNIHAVHMIYEQELNRNNSTNANINYLQQQYVTNKYDNSSQQINDILQKHYQLKGDVTHKLTFKSPTNMTNTNENQMVEINK